MRNLQSSALILTVVFIVGCTEAPSQTSTTSDAVRAFNTLIGAAIPSESTNIQGRITSFMTTAIDLRFTCSEDALQSLLNASPHLPKSLVDGDRTVVNTMVNEPWWPPDTRGSVRGVTSSWVVDNNAVSLHLMTGESDESNQIDVFIALTIEKQR